MNDIDIFMNNTIMNCVESSINTQFEDIIGKFNSGGNLEDCTPKVSDGVKTSIDEKIKEFKQSIDEVDMDTSFNKLKSILQPTGQNAEVQKQIKTIYESFDTFMKLNAFLAEGSQFYAKLTGALGSQ